MHSEFDMERQKCLDSVRELLCNRRAEARKKRAEFFRPSLASEIAYTQSIPPYRSALEKMLGWPLTEPAFVPRAQLTLIADDTEGRIWRVGFDLVGQSYGYGLLFLPRTPGRYPLVIAQHGGQGSPELVAGIATGSTDNYNELIRGLRRENVAVFAPQLLVWGKGQNPAIDQYRIDREFRHLGGSRGAFDLHILRASLNWLVTHPEIDSARIGMAGLSYGGFYTLFFTALEPRIRVAVSSCFVNDRYCYNWEDWVWTGSANTFLDSEVARMICPRPLFLEAGAKDDVFSPEGFPFVASEVAESYLALGLSDRFSYRIHPGVHEYDPDGSAREFLLRWL